jgi:DNA helicase-2/ATP-dependent DNA helicase PcrA
LLTPREEEQERLQEVLKQIELRLDKELALLGERREDVVGIRQQFWDDVRMNFSDATELGETWTSIMQQKEILIERERSHRVAFENAERLAQMHDNPYFARIDFAESGQAPERIYIGRASLVGDDGETFWIYDWRAPISSLFYDHEPGPAVYETPVGPIAGELTLKRQIVIRGGKLKHVFDTNETVGDEILQAVLSEKSDATMKSIVATIQKEQNRIIRDEKHRLLVVQGAAGSGKTSAALQRIAYLLYRFRSSLTHDQIVLFSPNPVFKGYISRVLPDLGETNMRQMTFRELVEAKLGRRFQVEDLFAQTEALHAAEGTPEGMWREKAARYKGSEHFFLTIERYLSHLQQEGVQFRPLRLRGETIVSAEEMARQYYAIPASGKETFSTRATALGKWLLGRLDAWAEAQLNEPWVEEAAELADDEDIQRAYVEIRRGGGFHGDAFDDEARMTEALKRRTVAHMLEPLRRAVKALRFLDPAAVYRALFRSRSLFAACAPDGKLPEGWDWMAERTDESLARKTVDHEDATPLLYLMEGLEGFRKVEANVQHVFVDEAQDYTPFQAAYLRKKFPRAKMTVLGDFNQAIYAGSQDSGGFGGWTRLMDDADTAVWQLTTSYRSTRQIVTFTKRILTPGEAAGIRPFERDGEPPQVIRCRDVAQLADAVAADIRGLLEAGHGTIGVIAKSARESGNASALLKERLPDEVPLTHVTGESAQLPRGVSVLPAYLAKGIEFDAVVVWDASAVRYGRDRDRKLLYTVCTRALHDLHVYYLGEPSPWLPDVENVDKET